MNNRERIELQLAGLDENHPLASTRYSTPGSLIHLSREKDLLCWPADPMTPHLALPVRLLSKARTVQSERRALDEFVALHVAPPEGIRRFARRWGTLDICEHGLPSSHNPSASGPQGVDRGNPTPCSPRMRKSGNGRWEKFEPLEEWRHYSQQIAGMLLLAANVLSGREAYTRSRQSERDKIAREVNELARLSPQGRVRASERKRLEAILKQSNFESDRAMLSSSLTHWLQMGGVMPLVTWTGTRAVAVVFGIHNLFASLAMQLALAIARSDGIAICSSCSTAFVPTRRPVADERRYCHPCRASGAPQRDAMRDYLERRKRSAEA